MKLNLSRLSAVIILSLIPTLLIWMPFFFRFESIWKIPLPKDGMATVVANYDGPLYIVVAKTLYNSDLINTFGFNLPSNYYAAHFPLFPLLIKAFAGFFGFPYSMLFVTVATSVLAIYLFHKLALEFVETKDAMWLTFIFSIFPARWLIVRSIGSPEPLFVAAIIGSIYYFRKEKYLLSGIWGIVAVLTKSPGILLFISYLLSIVGITFQKLSSINFKEVFHKFKLARFVPVLIIPLALVGLFCFYKIRMNDFLAYFHSGDNIHLFFPPFQIFNYSSPWVGTFWLEEIIFVYLLSIIGLLHLIKLKETTLAWFVGVFVTTTLFVSHRDLIRYSLPMVPFILIGYSKYLVKKEFKITMLVILIPIYLFSIAYISQNVMPIGNWAPLL